MTDGLTRRSSDAMIGGVCSGLARYLDIDVTWVRFFFVLLALGDGVGVLLYLVLWLVMPSDERVGASFEDNVRAGVEELTGKAGELGKDFPHLVRSRRDVGLLAGGTLIFLGVIFLLDNLNIPWLWWLSFDTLWPLLLVFGGAMVLVRALRKGA